MRIGFVGIGRMGLPMCVNLARAGFDVTAFDIRQGPEQEVIAAGARWTSDYRELCAGRELLITMLPGPGEVSAAMLGDTGLLTQLTAGATWLDMTSNSPVAVQPVRDRALALGIEVLEAPVGGGVPAARDGQLQLFVGGEPNSVHRCRAVLEVLAATEKIHYLGGHGAGYTAKLLVNLLWFGQAVATTEALLLGQAAELDLRVLQEVLGDSAAGSEFIRKDVDALLAGAYLESFGIDRVCEELDGVEELAEQQHLSFELSRHIGRMYRQALDRYGPVDGELLAAKMLEEDAGRQLRHGDKHPSS